MVNKYNLVFVSVYLFILLFTSCGRKFINFDEYIKTSPFINEGVFQTKDSAIIKSKYELRTIYPDNGTVLSLVSEPNADKALCWVKYHTKVVPYELLCLNETTWVKVKTVGDFIISAWIKSQYLEVDERVMVKD